MTHTQKTKRPGQHKGYPGPPYTHGEPTEVKVARISMTGMVITGFLGLIGVVIGVFFAFPPVIAYFLGTPTPSVTATLPAAFSPSATASPTVVADTPEPSEIPSLSPTGEPAVSKMIVILTSSVESGKSPLSVNFNARESFVQFANGSVAACGLTNFCTYTWSIYRDQKQILAPTKGESVFSFTFSGRGTYSVMVYICRTDICADDGIVITVR